MPPTGQGLKKILIVAEAPGKTEDEQGTQLVGDSGQLLREALASLGVDLDRDCRKTNAVCCRPPKNRKPTSVEIASCRHRLTEEIESFKPKLIILLGGIALESFLSGRWKKDLGGITQWRGFRIPDREFGCWVAPTFHPSFVLRSEGTPTVRRTFEDDLRGAVRCSDLQVTSWGDEKKIVRVVSEEEAVRVMDGLSRRPPLYLAIDYETTGLKPHRPGHRIKSAALAWYGAWKLKTEENAVAFTLADEHTRAALKEMILENDAIPKVAHNVPFEDQWSRHVLGARVGNWFWDTKIAAHCADNRAGITGLKFQTYVNFGLVDYDSEIEPFLQGTDPDDSNSMNRIDEAPLDMLLFYNGVDALETLRLVEMQSSALTDDQMRGYDLLHMGALALSDVTSNGIRADLAYCAEEEKRLTARVEEIVAGIGSNEVVKSWESVNGKKFNPNSGTQLGEILFGASYLALTPTETTETGKPSVTKEALDALADKAPFVRDLVEMRETMKARDTYLRAYTREIAGDLIHPFFHLTSVETYRSSSSNPNLQNVPVRDPKMQKIVRSAIVPRPGNQLMEIDYSGIEVRISACYHRDPAMIRYINDPTTDMHRDTAMDLVMIDDPARVSKKLRHASKNGFVFPAFYGSYYADIAPDLWKRFSEGITLADGETTVLDHLRSVGIKTYSQFEDRVKKVENIFWRERFPVYDRWKREQIQLYERRGFLELHTGFRCSGPLRRNQIVNYPIQGSAFHCLLWSLTQINALANDRGWKTKIVGQIHDSIIFDVAPGELDEALAAARKVMTEDVRAYWPWIIVPLDIEAEVAPTDEPWHRKEPIKR